MRKSDSLRAEEANQRSQSGDAALTEKNEFIEPNGSGVYEIQPIVSYNDFVIIAPIAPERTTKGGIVLTGQADRPSTGIVVGLPPGAHGELGAHVKFTPQHQVSDLSGHYPFYGTTIISAFRYASLVAQLPPLASKMVLDDTPNCDVDKGCCYRAPMAG